MIWYLVAVALIIFAMWRSQKTSAKGFPSLVGEDRTLEKRRARLMKEIRQHQAEIERLNNTPEGKDREYASAFGKNLVVKHAAVVDRFLEIAYRRISVRDDYGDPSFQALSSEMDRCLDKLATAEGGCAKRTESGLGLYVPGLDRPSLAILGAIAVESELKERFVQYYAKREVTEGRT